MTEKSFFTKIGDAVLPSRKQAKKLQALNTRLESFLHAIPVDYCGWSVSGVQAISPKFCELLGIKKVKHLDDIGDALNPGDTAALEGIWERLTERGESFDLIVRTVNDNRVLKLSGRRGSVPGSAEIFDVLWAMDHTEVDQLAKEHEEKLGGARQKEKEFKSALDNLPIPVWLRNDQLDISWCNKTYAKVLDETVATVIAEKRELPTTVLGKKQPVKGSRLLAQRALQDGEKKSENMHLVFEGDRKLVEVNETPLPEYGLIGSCADITEVEKLEEDIKHFMTSHNEVLEQLRTAIAIYGVDTRLEFHNLAYEQLWELECKWLSKKPKITDIFDKLREARKLPEQVDFRQFKDEWVSRFTSLMEPYEEMLYLPDDTVLRLVILPRPKGGLIVSYEDVTSRLELESSYNILVDVQQETLNNLAEGLAVFGEDGRLKLWNPTYASLWSLGVDDLKTGVHISELMEKTKPFFDNENWETVKAEMIQNGLARTGRKGRIVRADGTVLEYSVVPLPDGNVLNAYFDMTDAVKVEAALREKNAALEEAERLKLDFLANVSYQLRTPLNAIIGFTEILDQQYFGDLNDKQQGYTSDVLKAGQKLVTLIDDILDLSTIEAGYMELSKDDVDIKELMTSVETLTQEWARKQKIELKTKCSKTIGFAVLDEQRVKQVLLNLVSNAIRFTDAKGKIVVSAECEKEMLVLTVEDNGTGIAKEDLDRIFQPFERGQEQQRRTGAGLGLSLVKSIVDLHDGIVDINSEEGQGTTVICQFPLASK